MVKPILRPSQTWYTDNFEKICDFFDVGINTLGFNNITKLDAVSRMAQQFIDDGVHLTPAAGRMVVDAILLTAEAFYTAETVDLTENDKEMVETVEEGKVNSNEVASGSKKMHPGLEQRLSTLENDVKNRRFNDNLLMARTREELDYISNSKKEDRIIITGLSSNTPMPQNHEEKKIGSKNWWETYLTKFCLIPLTRLPS